MTYNTKRHEVGDTVYVQEYLWPRAAAKYTVIGIATVTGKPDSYTLRNVHHPEIEHNRWSYKVFDNVEDALEYDYTPAVAALFHPT